MGDYIIKEYLEKMYEEFKKAKGIEDSNGNIDKYQDLFNEWVSTKEKAASYYVKLFDYLENRDSISTKVIAEFGKGVYDTVTNQMAKYTEHQPIIVSRYARTIPEDSNIVAYSGNLLAIDSDVIVSYSRD